MRFQIPGTTDHVRLFERVNQPDGYDIFDVGLETERGIDSIAAGGSFASAKSWIKSKNDEAAFNKDMNANAKKANEEREVLYQAEWDRINELANKEGVPFQEIALREGLMTQSEDGISLTSKELVLHKLNA